MRLLLNIRHDVSLRNLTVYAQWASFSAIIACWIRGAWWLAVSFSSYKWGIHHRPHFFLPYSFKIIQTLNVVLFPVGPVAVIMPYLSKYTRYLFWMGMLWWYLLPYAYFFTTFNFTIDGMVSTWCAVLFLIFDFYLGMFTVPISKNPRSLRYLILFNLAFTAWISLWVGDIELVTWKMLPGPGIVRPHFVWPMVLAAMAAILYMVALAKGHDIVLSRTLGGPGIEPMSLILHSTEPEYNLIMNEGRIQLT